MASGIAEDMKTKYYELLTKYSKNKPQQTLMQEYWVNMMTDKVLTAKEILDIDGHKKLPKHYKTVLENYDVITVDEKPTLVKRSKELKLESEKIHKVVIPLERSFEIALNAHLCTRHGTSNSMFDWIERCNFAIATICSIILREVCMSMNEDCPTGYVKGLHILPLNSLKSLENPKPTKDTASVTLIDMTAQPDNSFIYLLIYKDLETSFVQLRPLAGVDAIDAIAMELTKLFCDFSPPKAIKVDAEMEDLFTAVLDRVNTIFDDKISLNATDTIAIDPLIEVKLSDWMMAKKSCSWSIGCHSVQWDMNNAKAKNGSPFEKFFGIYTDKKPSEARKRKTNNDADTKRETAKRTENNSLISKNDCHKNKQTSKNTSQVDTQISTNISQKDSQISTNITRPSVIQMNPLQCTPKSNPIQNTITIAEIEPTTSNVINSTTSDVSSTTNSTEPCPVKTEDDSDISTETGTHVCGTCEAVIRNKVYFCCVCNRSLHQYCGASKQSSDGVMESVCFVCL